jgi:signal transduction histidine kinase/ligand-binding sensor domain-containing protein
VAVAIGAFLLQPAHAMDPNRDVSQYIHDEWGSEQGFPGGPVNAITQTPDGYLWIGTEKGLVRYDGVVFRVVPTTVPGQPPIRSVLGLTADASGSLWVRAAGPTLRRYRDGAFSALTSDSSLPDALVTATARGRDGRLLLSSLGSGAFRESGGRFETLALPAALPRSVVLSISDTPSGDVWLGTRDAGLVAIRGATVSHIVTGLPDRKINSLLPGDNQELWIGTDKGVVRWSEGGITTAGVPAALANVQALSMIRDRGSNIWVGTASGGLLRVTAGGVSMLGARAGQPRGAVTSLFEDRDGNLWVGSARGLERIRDSAFTTYSSQQGLPSAANGPIYVDGAGRTWFAPSDGGVYYRLSSGQVRAITDAGLASDVVYSIAGAGRAKVANGAPVKAKVANGAPVIDVWIGRQRGGLTHLRESSGSWAATTYTKAHGLAQNSVYAVHESRDGAIWAGTLSGGVSRFKDGRFTTFTTADGLASNTITTIAEGADGTIWFGTPNGVSALSAGRWRNYLMSDGLPSNDVASLVADSAGVLWMGTAGGLAFFDAGRIGVPQKGPEILREPIAGLASDGRGSIWIAATNGVLRVARNKLIHDELNDGDARQYGLADGLQSVEGVRRHRSVVTDSGRVWFSLGRGLSMIDTARPDAGSVPAIAHVETLSVDGRVIDLGGAVRVPAGSHRLTFTYTGLSLSVPERIRFRYRLDGFDSAWSAPVAARETVYTNLGPGPYRFRVTASNSDGEWSNAEAAVDFSIAPRVWQTTWFQLAGSVAIILGSAGLYRLRMHQIARRLNVRFEERLAERTRIAQDLHDTLLQGFVSASMQLHVAAGNVPPDSPARASLDRVLQLMRRVIDEGRNAVSGLRSPTVGIDDLEEAFSRLRQELGVQDSVDYRVIVEGRPRPLHPVIRDEVYRVGREALVNAVRHSGAQTIEIEIGYAAGHVRVLVRDNGSGIDEHVLRSGREGHWGLSGMRERAERIGARLKVWSRPAAGTEIELFVPGHVAFQSGSRSRPDRARRSTHE